jgi:hypothetical protein
MVRSGGAPLFAIREATQASDLACAHCRASAAPRRHSSNLTPGRSALAGLQNPINLTLLGHIARSTPNPKASREVFQPLRNSLMWRMVCIAKDFKFNSVGEEPPDSCTKSQGGRL